MPFNVSHHSRFWLRAEVPATPPLRLLYPQQPTFKIQCLLFRVFVGCTPSFGHSIRGCLWAAVDPKPT